MVVLTLVFLEITSSNYFLQIYLHNLVCKATGFAWHLVCLGADKGKSRGAGIPAKLSGAQVNL